MARIAVPTHDEFAPVLRNLLRARGPCGPAVVSFERQANPHGSTFASEVVLCRLEDGSQLPVFCKYVAPDGHGGHGYGNCIEYEPRVYAEILTPLGLSSPRLFGVHRTERTAWLVLEYLDHAVPVSEGEQPQALALAAAWLGRFHLATERHLPAAAKAFLRTYDRAYYSGWAERTSAFAGELHQTFGWLGELCERFEEAIGLLLEAAPPIIHGEYYSKNVLLQRGLIRPIDWESAANAVGEIDLACLTDGWPESVVERCALAYQSARWGATPPATFRARFEAARMYVQFRWLGDWAPQTQDPDYRWRFEALRESAERLGRLG